MAALGREPDGPVLATIGWYAPIGSESSPIIQFFDSMGWHKLAERSLEFFLDRQREDGFIQNFGGYQLETGPALWTMGEHYRYTRDDGLGAADPAQAAQGLRLPAGVARAEQDARSCAARATGCSTARWPIPRTSSTPSC